MVILFIRIKRKLVRMAATAITKLLLKEYGIPCGKELIAVGMPVIEKHAGSSITIGDNAVLCSADYSNPLGINHRCVIRTLAPSAAIEIGNDVGMSGASICAAFHVKIGNDVMLGVNVHICDTDFHPLKPENRRYNDSAEDVGVARTVIEDNVWIGANVMVLKGVTIGKNSVIGAGSIVTGNIPANVIAAGIPARTIKPLVRDGSYEQIS
ncbi:acyltransferase [Paenibacillus oenotherae]|uniref:Acyltransferase n=1 Tax=Paenibacillus oenotherae TaxID=1435645 RepID=A0ABS7DAV0_9BACL|nr:acyltransferase [Paenibacillus oenotherae]MBW7476721.1 acyltransferase [Paenibacillus oenotherae]